MTTRIYLDAAATAPLATPVRELLIRLARESVTGNPSSRHQEGRLARGRIEKARAQLAGALNVEADTILFTSGGTEALNLAIYGCLNGVAAARRHILVGAIEHHAVSHPIADLEADGWAVTTLGVDGQGRVSVGDVDRALKDDVALVAVQMVNNEVGTVQPVEEIGALCRERGALFLCDMVQALGKLPIDLSRLAVDMAAFSAHKLRGPKGVGALYRRPGLELRARGFGGGQEQDLRPGTEAVHLIAGFGVAVEHIAPRVEVNAARIGELRDELARQIMKNVSEVRLNTPNTGAAPHILNVSVEGCRGAALVELLDELGIATSSGSACGEGVGVPSPVLLHMGRGENEARAALRFSLGDWNTAEDIAPVVDALMEVVDHVRALA